MLRKILTASLGLCLGLAMNCTGAIAAEWPGNWLGQPDNSYMSLHIGVHYYACVLDDMPDEQGVTPLVKGPGDALAELSALSREINAAVRTKETGSIMYSQWGDEHRQLADELMSLESEQTGALLEFMRVSNELKKMALFYWINSRFNCLLQFEYIPDFEPRLRSSIASSDAPYYSPVDQAVYGDERTKYDGLLQVMVMYRYNAEGKLERVTGGGGFTWGCDGPKHLCGWSWWAAPPASHACGSDWLFCHEFGHQLDSLFYASGHPEHWFNHLAESEANLARFGEHFDCMAYVLRRTKEADWLDLKWGELMEFADEDGDHVPDRFSYQRALFYETDPDSSDSDSDDDGMSDYDEVLCGNGNYWGHGERLHEALGYCSPTDEDSDNDGLPDGADEYPYVPLKGSIRQAAPDAAWLEPVETHPDDEAPSPTGSEPASIVLKAHYDWLPKSHEYEPQLRCELQYQQDHALHLRVLWADLLEGEPLPDSLPGEQLSVPCDLRLTFDFDNDGWFSGNDNYRLLLDETGVISVIRNVCYSTTEGPTEVKDAVDIIKIPCSVLHDVDGYDHGLDLTLPHSLFPELAAKAGEEFGFNLGIRHKPHDPKVNAWFYMIYDPNALMRLELR